MNKAFVREPDEPDAARCPSCGAMGDPTPLAVVVRHLAAGTRCDLAGSSHFCRNPRCPVGYFDATGLTIPASAVTPMVFPKDAAAPVCVCLNLCAGDVESDAKRGDVARVRGAVQQAQRDPGQCERLMPTGKPCTGEIQKLFLRTRR
jgi:hypothetical protein